MNEKEKECPKCHRFLSYNNYYKDKYKSNGYRVYCKECCNDKIKNYRKLNPEKDKSYSKKYYRSFDGWFRNTYHHQIKGAKKRGMDLPVYTKDELKNYVLKYTNFDELFKNWVESGYKKDLYPSIDRLDNNKSYTLDNIRLVTWKVNFKKSNQENKTPIIQLSLSNKIIKIWDSIQEACKSLKLSSNGYICQCIQGKRKTAYGFKWKYINNF